LVFLVVIVVEKDNFLTISQESLVFAAFFFASAPEVSRSSFLAGASAGSGFSAAAALFVRSLKDIFYSFGSLHDSQTRLGPGQSL
jgi:hypothetical protein